jgi:hypothetical protein
MGVAGFSKMLVALYQTTWHSIPEDYNVKIETIVFEYTFSHETKFSYLFLKNIIIDFSGRKEQAALKKKYPTFNDLCQS